MPHIANTPETILPRADSRNPAVTCRGITTGGRPCRRALASSTASSPSLAAKRAGGQLQGNAAALFCWQHKDQAPSNEVVSSRRESLRLDHRSSMDTLMDRLGILDINDEKNATTSRRRTRSAQEPRKPRRTFCCFEIVDDDEETRPSKPVHGSGNRQDEKSSILQQPYQGQWYRRPQSHRQARPSPVTTQRPSSRPQSSPLSQKSPRPTLPRDRESTSSQTRSLLSWIPPSLSPQTTSHLLTELAKPVSSADEEGYIYMFWVTPSAPSPPPADLASSLFPSTQQQRPANRRSVSDALREADDANILTSRPTSTQAGTVRLKIGRTSNVQRRLNEWTRQCSHHLTLIRYYPYQRPSSSPASPGVARKVPHVHRVERLIHLELADVRVRDLGRCSECNREHREWFEVLAEKKELRRVEECIRRWVQWGERQDGYRSSNA